MDGGFQHEALLYEGERAFVDAVVPFIEEGATDGGRVMVAVSAGKIELLTTALGDVGAAVSFVDMAAIGRNPATVLPAWTEFVSDAVAAGVPVRGIGEPVWAARASPELAEWALHESLLNVEFDGGPSWQLLCPYDVSTLGADALTCALEHHPFLRDGHGRQACRANQSYRPAAIDAWSFGGPLGAVPAGARSLMFDAVTLRDARQLVAGIAAEAGFGAQPLSDLVLAVGEAATNSVAHGGGRGTLRVWCEPDAVVCDVQDAGRLEDPLVGRRRPAGADLGGRGLWIANQLCDLVQVRSGPDGTRVRLRMNLA